MTIRRKSHNLDEQLLSRAKRALGVRTETDAIHEALRAVLLSQEVMADLRAVRGRPIFRDSFVKAMREEGAPSPRSRAAAAPSS